MVAGSKPRIKGKFVSNDEFKLLSQKDSEKKDLEAGLSEMHSESQSDSKIEECA
eukprot:CAMPEP_0176439110 /NCGR_PEP_ID=MMETSP0127-20121128/19736_1 /TAXON_ID=938130 /ORGANISM="Platyophrya macrostoma, Strain WH" /LENGTH=53 /DNA_ID=CAMNT_0017823293 /DNA_START=395 /DNA_END=556 /DNA_ORIENTATION=-